MNQNLEQIRAFAQKVMAEENTAPPGADDVVDAAFAVLATTLQDVARITIALERIAKAVENLVDQDSARD